MLSLSSLLALVLLPSMATCREEMKSIDVGQRVLPVRLDPLAFGPGREPRLRPPRRRALHRRLQRPRPPLARVDRVRPQLQARVRIHTSCMLLY
jgi:hypothetical protein